MRRIFLVLSVALVMNACFSLSREAPPIRQYVLGGMATVAADAPAPQRTGLTLGLRRLDLTPYLASPAIVVRRGGHQVLVSEYHRWGEDPVAGINRAFAGHLAATAPVRAVDVAPWPVRSRHDVVVQLHVSRFEGVMPEDTLARFGEAHLMATWELSRPLDGRVVARGTTDYRADGWLVGDYAGLVALLDGALNHMAGDIVTCIGRAGLPASGEAAPMAAEAAPATAEAAPAAVEPPLACHWQAAAVIPFAAGGS